MLRNRELEGISVVEEKSFQSIADYKLHMNNGIKCSKINVDINYINKYFNIHISTQALFPGNASISTCQNFVPKYSTSFKAYTKQTKWSKTTVVYN